MVHVAGQELQTLLQEPGAAVSPLLCLSQSSPFSFLRPVIVQLPLPPGITGRRRPWGMAGPVAMGWEVLLRRGALARRSQLSPSCPQA